MINLYQRELYHSAKGREWKDHKYKYKYRSKKSGKWVYVYGDIDMLGPAEVNVRPQAEVDTENAFWKDAEEKSQEIKDSYVNNLDKESNKYGQKVVDKNGKEIGTFEADDDLIKDYAAQQTYLDYRKKHYGYYKERDRKRGEEMLKKYGSQTAEEWSAKNKKRKGGKPVGRITTTGVQNSSGVKVKDPNKTRADARYTKTQIKIDDNGKAYAVTTGVDRWGKKYSIYYRDNDEVYSGVKQKDINKMYQQYKAVAAYQKKEKQRKETERKRNRRAK